MVDHVQIWFFLPIRGLPYTGLLVTFTHCITWLEQEVTFTAKIIVRYVNKNIVLNGLFHQGHEESVLLTHAG